MKTTDNFVYLVSTASFAYNDEGYTANEEGVVPVKVFMTEKSAKEFGHKILVEIFETKADELVDAVQYESMTSRSISMIENITGEDVRKYFKTKTAYRETYYYLNSEAGFAEMLEHAAQTRTFEQLQEIYRIIRGVNYIEIKKIPMEL